MIQKPILQALIVDDEAPARSLLRELLKLHPNIQIVGEASSAASAVEACATLKPDVIFLDIQMPDGDGFSVLPKLEPLPAIVFVTAYDEFAVRAFEINAVDYLLKPPRADRLASAIQRILIGPKRTKPQPFRQNDQIFLPIGTSVRVAFVTEISGIQGEGNYSRVFLTDGTSTFMRRGLAEWMRILPEEPFLRVHRSLILNLKAVQRVFWDDRQDMTVAMAGFSVPIRLGRRPALRLRKALREPDVL